MPVRRYDPPGETTSWIIFSVGYGGNRDGYGYLARTWCQSGAVVLVTEHVGSNLEVLKSLPQKTRELRNREVVRRVQEPPELIARPQDLELVFHHFAPELGAHPLGLGGHSFGSYSVLAACGLGSNRAETAPVSLPAKGLLVMSPQPPGLLFAQGEYKKLTLPTLLVTGTKDHLLSGGADYTDRLKVWDELPSSSRYVALLEGLEHMTFAGVGLNIGSQLRLVESITSRWWEGPGLGLNRAWGATLRAEFGRDVLPRLQEPGADF